MTKYFILSIFFFISVTSFAQKTLSDYSYVVVPDQFDFLEGKDKFQLNSLTEYLFNKYGFNAYLNSEAPNARRCDGLYADIKENNSIFKTRLTIILKDCNGNVTYTGKEGVSRIKEYREAYQDAIRKAFKSVRELGVNQKDVELLGEQPLAEANTTDKIRESKNNSTSIINTTNNATEIDSVDNVAVSNLPKAKFLNYTKDGTSFLLRKTNKGYSLYKESTEAENGLALTGTITVTNSEVKFKSTKDEMYDVYFDENQNLSLFKGETVVLYKLVR